jgi:hypothetical protein
LATFGSNCLTKKGAVVPSFQYSDKLKALLVAAQRQGACPVVLPTSDQPLAAVLESFSFAKQRFDSTVDPKAKLSLMLMPVATVLAFLASDARVPNALRRQAKDGLEFLTSKNCAGLGVSADWGIVWEAFLRLFDAGDHDIARSSEEIEGLIESLEALFVDGAVFQDRLWREPVALQPAIGGKLLPPIILQSSAAEGVDGQFINALVRKNIKHRCVFNVNGDPVVIWGALRSAEQAEIASRIKNVSIVSIGRVRADFPKSEMRFFLRAFDMPLVHDAFNPQGCESKREALTRCCQAALKAMRCPEDSVAAALLEYKALATLLAGLAAPGQPLATKTNRETWGLCLDPAFLDKHLPPPPSNGVLDSYARALATMQDLVRFYESILDGSCGVEVSRGVWQRCGHPSLSTGQQTQVFLMIWQSWLTRISRQGMRRRRCVAFGRLVSLGWNVACFGGRSSEPAWAFTETMRVETSLKNCGPALTSMSKQVS